MQSLHNGPLLVLVTMHREAVHEALLDAVRAIGHDAHRHPVVAGRAEPPATHVITNGFSRAHGRREFARGQNSSASLLHNRYELVLDPVVVVDGLVSALRLVVIERDFSVAQIRKLCGRVVTPNDHVLDVVRRDVELEGDLAFGAVVIETSETREVFGGQRWSVLGRDETVCVGRVADYQHFDALLGMSVQGDALLEEKNVKE